LGSDHASYWLMVATIKDDFLLTFLRRLRHGALSGLGPFWIMMGRWYRRHARFVPWFSTPRMIGPYGPFRLSAEFAFSNLDRWGSGHNQAFRTCIEACRDKRCVLDVGAHVGFVSLPMAFVLGKGGHVYAFEPAAANAGLLRKHLRLNHVTCVTVIESLVGAQSKSAADFFEGGGVDGMNSTALQREFGQTLAARGYARVSRPQVSLDEFCHQRNISPEIIKIDVEGAEIEVLRGARTILLRDRPLIILSVHPNKIELLGGSTELLTSMLVDVGYEIRDAQGQPVERMDLDEYLVVPT
jgi:FkbM family methyltransferase